MAVWRLRMVRRRGENGGQGGGRAASPGRWMLWAASFCLWRSGPVRLGDLVDDALEEDDADVETSGHVGQELDNEVFDGRSGQADAVALGGRWQIGLPARHVKVA